LRAIDGFSRILLREYAEKLDDEGQRFIDIIRDNTRKMGQLIDDLLTFSRLGRKPLKLSCIDMDKLTEEVLEELKVNIPERNLQLQRKNLPPVQGDRALLRQVLVNLISNAIKYTEPRETAVMEIGAQVEPGKTTYYLKDNGVGFDMRYVDKLFGVFQRLHSDEEFEGTGIGLANVRRIIDRHGGEVWAEGEINQGSIFYFTLPGEVKLGESSSK
jgi:two-component system sensor kinase